MLGVKRESLHKSVRLVSSKNGKNDNGKLTGKLLDYLENKYHLLPQDMLSLRAVKTKGSLGSQRVWFVRVYDQETSERSGIHIRLYNDLDKQPNLILYNGYILENDFAYITKCDSSVMYQTSEM